jgi:hypothetical protein
VTYLECSCAPLGIIVRAVLLFQTPARARAADDALPQVFRRQLLGHRNRPKKARDDRQATQNIPTCIFLLSIFLTSLLLTENTDRRRNYSTYGVGTTQPSRRIAEAVLCCQAKQSLFLKGRKAESRLRNPGPTPADGGRGRTSSKSAVVLFEGVWSFPSVLPRVPCGDPGFYAGASFGGWEDFENVLREANGCFRHGAACCAAAALRAGRWGSGKNEDGFGIIRGCLVDFCSVLL